MSRHHRLTKLPPDRSVHSRERHGAVKHQSININQLHAASTSSRCTSKAFVLGKVFISAFPASYTMGINICRSECCFKASPTSDADHEEVFERNKRHHKTRTKLPLAGVASFMYIRRSSRSDVGVIQGGTEDFHSSSMPPHYVCVRNITLLCVRDRSSCDVSSVQGISGRWLNVRNDVCRTTQLRVRVQNCTSEYGIDEPEALFPFASKASRIYKDCHLNRLKRSVGTSSPLHSQQLAHSFPL